MRKCDLCYSSWALGPDDERDWDVPVATREFKGMAICEDCWAEEQRWLAKSGTLSVNPEERRVPNA